MQFINTEEKGENNVYINFEPENVNQPPQIVQTIDLRKGDKYESRFNGRGAAISQNFWNKQQEQPEMQSEKFWKTKVNSFEMCLQYYKTYHPELLEPLQIAAAKRVHSIIEKYNSQETTEEERVQMYQELQDGWLRKRSNIQEEIAEQKKIGKSMQKEEHLNEIYKGPDLKIQKNKDWVQEQKMEQLIKQTMERLERELSL